MEVKESDRVRHIKEKIENQEGIPVYCQLLKFNWEELEHNRVFVSYYDIEDGSIVDLEG